MTTPPDAIDTLARTLVDAIATGIDQEHITDDEWNDPDIAATRTAISNALREALGDQLGLGLAARFTPEQLGHLKEDADTVRDSVTHWDSWALLADALAQAANG